MHEQNKSLENKKEWKPILTHIATRWAEKVDPQNPFPEYPRPQLKRTHWINLNGLWEYKILPRKKKIEDFRKEEPQGKILVPYPIESALSGVAKALLPSQKLWYKRTFTIPYELKNLFKNTRFLLHFGAVDYEAEVWINNTFVGKHKGGDVGFSFDITHALKYDESEGEKQGYEQEIIVAVWDPTDKGLQERGKQMLNPYGIFYSAVSGIWQTVWIEPVPSPYIKEIHFTPLVDEEKIRMTFFIDGWESSTKDGEKYIIKTKIKTEKSIIENESPLTPFQESKTIEIEIENPVLWSPDNPFLYETEHRFYSLPKGSDQNGQKDEDLLTSYFGMRKISLVRDKNGILRMALNNKILFQYGPLDQGWWPDGLYTAPTDDALKWDIEIAKKMGFNMIRKHVKVEPQRWYYYCDTLGMLVWQDMPSGGRYGHVSWIVNLVSNFIFKQTWHAGRSKKQVRDAYYNELKEMITQFYSHPSIVVWVPFNEAWGQFETEKVTLFTKELDPYRLVDSASGWTDKGTGDIHSIHAYPGPKMPKKEEKRALALSEFGGLGLPIPNHIWNPKKRNWGYKTYHNKEELKKHYVNLIENLIPLIEKGLSAAVYTQITDVEGEVNGLITYDREVIKIEEETLKQLHEELYKHPTL